MARKKKSSRKKTNIESLTPNVPETSETSESTETIEESTQNTTEVNPPPTEESTDSSDLARPPAAEKKPESTQSSAPASPPATEKRPYIVIKPKPIPAKLIEKQPPPPPVTEATNKAGELFQKGDQITVKAPWGGEATAEIVDFYQTHSGKIWAQYNPLDSQPNWTWHSGCIRTNILEKATQTAQE
ncbi:MAG: hypothetical protein RID09_21900 [Coleofasciculus sp. G1-WW12-02]|uniref:hypothetical protein n=1 Tax=Coleofasciculus sp. G1-WW12-02 TaxID=3068483 RepID=UPI0032F3CF5F